MQRSFPEAAQRAGNLCRSEPRQFGQAAPFEPLREPGCAGHRRDAALRQVARNLNAPALDSRRQPQRIAAGRVGHVHAQRRGGQFSRVRALAEIIEHPAAVHGTILAEPVARRKHLRCYACLRSVNTPAKHIFVVAAIIERDACILICRRRHDGAFPLKWEFPGGKVKSGESPQQALARELREELGIEAEIGAEIHRARHTYSSHALGVELHFFAARIAGGEPRNLDFEEIAWVERARLSDYDFLDADREFVARFALM